MVPIRPGDGETLGAPDPEVAGVLPGGELEGLGLGVGVVSATLGAGGIRPERSVPMTIAARIAPTVAPIEVSEARSVGTMPSGPARRGTSVVIGAPQLRQT